VKIELTVNGLKIQAQYQNEEIENVHKPLLHMLAALQTVNPQRRTDSYKARTTLRPMRPKPFIATRTVIDLLQGFP